MLYRPSFCAQQWFVRVWFTTAFRLQRAFAFGWWTLIWAAPHSVWRGDGSNYKMAAAAEAAVKQDAIDVPIHAIWGVHVVAVVVPNTVQWYLLFRLFA
jgi:hypothetical protein